MQKLKRIYSLLPYILIVFIGVIYFFMSFDIPMLGDDLGFYHSFAQQNDTWYAYPRYMYRHWLWNNGRLSDMLSPIGLYLMPGVPNALLNGGVTALFYFIIVRFCGLHRRLSVPMSVLVIFIITFTFRWDSLWMEFITQYCYVFTAAFALCGLGLFFAGARIRRALVGVILMPFCFIAAAMHEAMGVPLAVGLAAWIFTNRKRRSLTGAQRLIAVALIGGGIFPLTSPPAWGRIGFMLQPEPLWEIFVFSTPWLIVLAISSVIMVIADRQRFRELVASPWLIFAIGAVVGIAFLVGSRFGGRPGWFCQIMSLIAVVRMWRSGLRHFTVPRIPAAVAVAFMILAVVLHFVAVAVTQHRLAKESRSVISAYEQSPDGIVYFDYTDDPSLPWYLFRKNHGVPDEDDTYYRYRIGRHHGHGQPLIILPTGVESISLDTLSGQLKTGRFFITDRPAPDSYDDIIFEMFPRRMVRRDGIEYIEVPFMRDDRQYYLYSPVDRDRGEK